MDTAANTTSQCLTFVQGCTCAGSGCGGHLEIKWPDMAVQYTCQTCGARATVAWGGAWMNDTYSCDQHSPVGIYPPGTQLPAGFWMRSVLPVTGPVPYSTGHLGAGVPWGT